jgi:hypothetical protein
MQVTIFLMPVAAKAWFTVHQLLEFIFRHGGIPFSSIADAHLFSCLFKEVTGVSFIVEIADAFGAYDVFGSFAGHKLIKTS